MFQCNYCNRRFRTRITLSHHHRFFHKQKELDSPITDSQQDDEPVFWPVGGGNASEHGTQEPSSQSSSEKEHSSSGQEQSNMDTEEEQSQSETDNNSNDPQADEQEELISEVWKELVCNAIEGIDCTTENLLDEPSFSLLHQQLGEGVSRFIRKAKEFDDSILISKIRHTANNIKSSLECDKKESFESAWNARKYKVREFLKEHREELLPATNEEAESTDNEQMDSSSDQPACLS